MANSIDDDAWYAFYNSPAGQTGNNGSFWGELLNSMSYNVTGGIIGNGAPVTLSSVLASLGYIVSQTPRGQQVIKDAGVTYVTTQASNNWVWLAIIGVLGALLMVVTFSKRR